MTSTRDRNVAPTLVPPIEGLVCALGPPGCLDEDSRDREVVEAFRELLGTLGPRRALTADELAARRLDARAMPVGDPRIVDGVGYVRALERLAVVEGRACLAIRPDA